MAFDSPAAPGQREAGSDRVLVAAQTTNERAFGIGYIVTLWPRPRVGELVAQHASGVDRRPGQIERFIESCSAG